jgi:hypothetical protein
LIATAKNKGAGAMIVAGTFLFFLAIGINTIYSIQTGCLDIEPRQCYTGYDALTESQKIVVSPGLYILAVSFAILGAVIWFKKAKVQEAPRT